jgi:MarR family transcriptional regulator, transcriptional regulator for hemolysin
MMQGSATTRPPQAAAHPTWRAGRICARRIAVRLAPYHNVAYYSLVPQADYSQVHDFQRDLMFLLHDVARLIRVDADKRARAHGMTRAQWGILIWLERQAGLSQKELAEILEVEPITVARLIDRLEGRGMVERRPDPKDRRIWRLHLRPSAYGVLGEIDRQRELMRARITEGLDSATIETMTEALLTMKTTLTHDSHPPRRFASIHTDARELA